jgi:hypothetical protein
MAAEAAREFGVARSKIRHGLFLALGLLVFGVWILTLGGESIPDRNWIGLLALGLGLGLGFYAWRAGRRAGVQLRIDESGIWFKDWGVTVPWRDVADAYQTGHRLQPFVALRLEHPERFIGALSAPEARKLQGDRLWKAPELRIPNGAVDAPQRELLDLLRAGLKVYASRGEEPQSTAMRRGWDRARNIGG